MAPTVGLWLGESQLECRALLQAQLSARWMELLNEDA
jgi:hypothetical protein